MMKLKMSVKSKKMRGLTLLVLFALFGFATYSYICLHTDRQKVQTSLAKIIVYSHYEITQDGRTVLSFDADTTQALASFFNKYALIPSCEGRLYANIDTTIWNNKFSKTNADTLLNSFEDSLQNVYMCSKWKVSELTYYLHSHNVADEGYNRIAQYTDYQTHVRDTAKKMLDSIAHIKKGKHLKIVHKQNIVAVLKQRYKVKKLSNQVFQVENPSEVLNDVTPLVARQAKDLMLLNIQPLEKMPHLYYPMDSIGQYVGDIDSVGRPNGHGIYTNSRGAYYQGGWKAGKREGFGFSADAKKQLRVGEWKADRYKGERVVYSSDRIYGIDISKYQHVKGKKKYPINWSQLRITNLGKISKKTISGKVNFPIKFIYIKSTEGSTLTNAFYRKDYIAARAHGFKVGTYHFFSTTSPAATQARHFLKHSFVKQGDFPPVLDVEPTHEQIKKMGGAGVLFSRIRTWLRIVQNQTGMKPVLYISQTFVNRYLSQAPDLKHGYNIWIARYGEYKPDIHLIYWQLCPDGRVAGIHGEVDINIFNGYQDAFDKFAQDHAVR